MNTDLASFRCKYCSEDKFYTLIGKYSNGARKWKDELGRMASGITCVECSLSNQRLRRSYNKNSLTKRYEKTPHGFLMRLYRNMKSRIEGVQKLKAHLYCGKSLMPKEDFYKWAGSSIQFWVLWNNYKDSNFDRKLAPSADRIDSSKGYEIDNLEWVTMSENSRRGSINAHKKQGHNIPD